MNVLLGILLSVHFLIAQECTSFESCSNCFDAECFWQSDAPTGYQCNTECLIMDTDCYGTGNGWVAECPESNCCEAEENAIEECAGIPGCFIPQCTDSCGYEPMQCSGSTGWCWCVDETGVEIEGTAQPSWQGYPECENLSCVGENPAGCFQNGCEDGYACIDFGNSDTPGFCVSSFCSCDESTGQWYCTDDCNGGTCVHDEAVVGEICIADDINNIYNPGYWTCDLECWETEEIDSWVNDGFCDDGGFGADLICPEFECDGGDCGVELIDGECINCNEEFQGTGDITQDYVLNVLDIVQSINIILSFEPPTLEELCILDVNEDEVINVLDIVIIVDWILNPVESSFIINTGTSFGMCWGYCKTELELNGTEVIYKEYSWIENPDFPELILEDHITDEQLDQILNTFDFEEYLTLDNVYGCPDCADGGAEWIEITHDNLTKHILFEFYSTIPGHDDLVEILRELRDYFHGQLEE